MTFTIKGSHIVAVLITALIGFYMYFGDVEVGGQSSAGNQAPPIAERESEADQELFRVSYIALKPETRTQTISMRGRTKADAVIPLKSETSGILRQRLVNRGDTVEEGQLVCTIDQGAREVSVASAKAALEKAEADYKANQALKKKGFSTDNKMRELKAGLDAAKAQLRQAEIELDRTEIRSNMSGVVMDPIAEPGDVLQAGGTCITVVDRDPMYFVGQLSESDIGAIQTGMKAHVRPVTGEEADGVISYIAPAADPETRTFRIEIELSEEGSAVRDGITASASIALEETEAYRLSPSWLTLADDGQVGIKTINENDEVDFRKVDIVSQGNDGFWVEKLEEGLKVITLGQEYVVTGEKVEPVMQQAKKTETAE
jgi:multidrug efflux system membrane fusion protein